MRTIVTPLLLLLLSSALSAQAAATASVSAGEVFAIGSGTVRLRPDRAIISLAVVTRARSAPEAARANAARMSSVLDALRRAGVADSAINTAGFAVGRDDQLSDAVPSSGADSAHYARNIVSITTTDLGGIATLLDAALDAGATDVSGIRYASSRSADARRDAIALAVREARANAEAAAAAAGGSLGGLRSLNVNPGYAGGDYSGSALSSIRIATPIFPTDVAETMNVQIRYTFVPGR